MRASVLILPLALLAACGSGGGSSGSVDTSARVATPTQAGQFTGTPAEDISTATIGFGPTDGYAVRIAYDSGNRFSSVAGLLPQTDVTAPQDSGTVTYSGRYDLYTVTDFEVSGEEAFFDSERTRGDMTLTADFDANTLTGASQFGGLTVNGTLDGADLTGTTTYRGVTGTLKGLIGGDAAYGAFAGADASLLYAGGFRATPD